ncbi:MAG: tetratricopeptide repeat-containing sensor histidine kinase [Bacteroidota bacterium]
MVPTKVSITCICVLLLLNTLGFAQVKFIEELKDKSVTGEVQEKIAAFNQLGWHYRKVYPDSSIHFLKESLALLSTTEDKTLKPECFNFLGVAYLYKGDYINSYDYHQEAKDLALANQDSLQYAHALNSLGRLYEGTAGYDKAIEYYNQALSVFKSLGDKIGLAYIYSSLATFYQSQKSYGKAEEMSKRALALRMEEEIWAGVAFSYLELAKIYGDAEKHDLALNTLKMAQSFSDSVQANLVLKAEVNTEIANQYRNRGKFEEAVALMEVAEKTAKGISNQNLFMKVYNEYGKLNHDLKKYEQAIDYHKKVVKAAENSAFWAELKNAYLELSRNYDKLGSTKQAYENFKKYNEIEIKFLDTEKARLVQQHDTRIALETRAKENELLKIEKQKNEALIARQELRNLALIGLVMVMFLLAVLFMFFSIKRKKDNAKITQKKNELAELNLQKDTLLNIMAHDLRAPFNRIVGLLDLMKVDKENTTQYIKMIEDMGKSGVDLIKNILEVNKLESGESAEVISTVNVEEFLREKIKNHQADAIAKQIAIKSEINIRKNFSTNELYLERIVDNLISNAIKYSNRDSEVKIKASKEDNQLAILVEDNGPGFTAEDKKNLFQKFKTLSARPTAGETSNGLGLSLVKTLVDKLGGEITLRSEVGFGSTFEVLLPELL